MATEGNKVSKHFHTSSTLAAL